MSELKNKIKNTIEEQKLINSGDVVILGLSGGPDSTCLFDVLLKLSSEIGFTMVTVHVNHGFRDETAKRDQEYAEQLSKDRGVKCHIFTEDCQAIAKEQKMTNEEAGRLVRYGAFFSVAAAMVEEGRPIDKIRIATAHNSNDQVETLAFRILRGTGIDGLAGMEYMRRDKSGFIVVRPLLDINRKEIEAYCQKENLNPCMDETNDEPLYARNKIRLELLPYIEKNYNPNIGEALRRLSLNARYDREFLRGAAERVLNEVCIGMEEDVCTLNKDLLLAQEKAIRHRVIIKAFEEIGLTKDISYAHLAAADRVMESGVTSTQVDFPRGYILRVSYQKVECILGVPKKDRPIPLDLKVNVIYKEDYIKKENQAIFDMDKMAEVYDFAGGPLNMIISRTRESGDFIKLAVGTKSIQDFFVDLKVPKNLRNTIYMAAIGNEILWIPEGVTKARYSDCFKVDENTERLLVLEMESELW